MPSGQGSLSPNELENILLFVGVENILSPEEWLIRLQGNCLHRNDLCITLDDGLRCQYDHCLPVLEKYGLKAFLFIFSSVFDGGVAKFEIYNNFATRYFRDIDDFYMDFFGRCGKSVSSQFERDSFHQYAQTTRAMCPFYSKNDLKFRYARNELLTQDEFEHVMGAMIEEKGHTVAGLAEKLWLSNSELESLSLRGHVIGLHSYDHPFQLSKLSIKEQSDQYERNYAHIRRVCGKEVVSMSHPLNSYGEDTLKILKGMGIVCGFRSNMMPPHGRKINPTPLELAREDATNLLKAM